MNVSIVAVRDIESQDVIWGMGKNEIIPAGTSGQLVKMGVVSSVIEFDGFDEVQILNRLFIVDDERIENG